MAINLGPGATLSDAQVQLQQLQQRQAIAAAMEKAGLATGQSPTVDAGVLKVANFGDPITKIINAFAGQNLQSGINQDQADLQKQQSAIQQKGISDYFAQRSGIDNNQPGPPEETGVGPAPRLTQPDTLGAVKGALSSQDPLLQQIAMGDLSAMNKGIITPSDILAHGHDIYTNASIQNYMMTGDKSVLKPKANLVTVGENRVQEDQSGYVGPHYTAPQPVAGAAPGTQAQTNEQSGELKYSPPQTNISVDTKGEGAFAHELGTGRAQALQKMRDTTLQGVQNLPSLQAAYDAVGKTDTGMTADAVQGLRQVAASLGVDSDTAGKISNASTFRAAMAPAMLATVRHLGTGNGISDADRKWSQSVTLSELNNDPRAIRRAIKLQAANTVNSQMQLENEVQSVKSGFPQGADMIESMRVPAPAVPPGWLKPDPTGNPFMTVDDSAEQALQAPSIGHTLSDQTKGPYQIQPGTESILKGLGL